MGFECPDEVSEQEMVKVRSGANRTHQYHFVQRLAFCHRANEWPEHCCYMGNT